MCGIAGEIRLDGKSPDASLTEKMVASLLHRGPDEDGHYAHGALSMGMRRLSIVGLTTGKQPLMDATGNLALVFNGEIYNYPELKRHYESKGRTFLSGSDGEAILALYEDKGLDFLAALGGMFSLALYDKAQDRLVLARDAMGIKPLFLQEIPGGLLFASEIKAILAHPKANPQLNPDALAAYLCLSYSPLDGSVYEKINRLMPGEALVVEKGKVRRFYYFKLQESRPPTRSEAPTPQRLREKLEEAVKLELLADVPIGAFLSGGVDSSAVVALMRPHVSELTTFCLGFEGAPKDMDERERAALTAKHLGAEHIDIVLKPQAMADAFDEALRYFDEPFGGGLHTWFLSKEAAKTHKVVLTGIGSDELLGGYRRNLRLPKLALLDRLPGFVGGLFATLAHKVEGDATETRRRMPRLMNTHGPDRYFQWISNFSFQELGALFQPGVLKRSPLEGLFKRSHAVFQDAPCPALPEEVAWLETRTTLVEDFLSYTDRTTMAHSLEARVPFLNRVMVEETWSWPWRQRFEDPPKQMLYQAVADLLPKELADREKKPFLLPLAAWLRGPLNSFLHDTLLSDTFASGRLLKQSEVRNLVKAFENGQERAFQVWHLMGLERFLRLRPHGEAPSL